MNAEMPPSADARTRRSLRNALAAALVMSLATGLAPQATSDGTDDVDGAVAAARAAREALGPPAFVGRAIDGGGNPLVGVRVAALARDALHERHARHSLFAPCLAQGRVETTTGADGSFAITDPERVLGPAPVVRWEIGLLAPGFAPHTLTHVALPGAGAVELGAIVLEPGRELVCVVQDAHGVPVANALVALAPIERDGRGGIACALALGTTARDGELDASVPAGTWTLVVASSEHPETRFETVISDADQLARIELELPRGESITGHLLSEPEQSSAEVLVHALPLERMSLVPEIAGQVAGQVGELLGARAARVEADGRFELSGLEPGLVYALRALPARVDPLNDDAWAGSALMRAPARDVRLILRRDAALELVVSDGRGEPVEGFAVHVDGALPERFPPELPERPGHARHTADAGQGALRFAHHPGGHARLTALRSTADDEVRLWVEAPGHEAWHSERYVLLPGGTLQVGRVILAQRPTLAVRVVDGDGHGVSGAVVRLAADGPPLAVHETVADRDGRARVNDERGVPRRLGIVAPGYAPRLVRDPFVAYDETELVVELEPESAIAVAVFGHDGTPAVGVPVEHRALDPRGDSALAPDVAGHAIVRSDTRGVALFVGLGAGEHAFELVRHDIPQAHERGVVRVGRAALEALSLTADFETRVRGVVLDGGRPLPGAVLAWRRRGGQRDELAATADDRGRFEIEALERGRWRVEVSHSGAPRPAELAVTLERDAQDLVLEAGLGTTWLQIAHADGSAAAGAGVFVLAHADADVEIEEGANVFALTAPRRPDAVVGAHGLVALHLGRAAQVVVLHPATRAAAVLDLPLGEDDPRALVLQPPASLALEREHWPPPGQRALVLLPERGFPALAARIVFPYRGEELQQAGLPSGTWVAWMVTLDSLGRATAVEPVATIDLVAGQRTYGALPR